jgi:putative ABC transport system permease protein
MRWSPDRYDRLRTLLRGRRVEAEVAEEFEHHVSLLAEELEAAGLNAAAARAEAMRRFGDLGGLREETAMIDEGMDREQRRAELIGSLGRELRLAVRSLGRAPGFAAAAIITLALGIGATTSIYTLLDAVVLRPLPYAQAERLVQIGSAVPGMGEDQRWGLSMAGYYHFVENARTLEAIGVRGSGQVTVTGDFEAERVTLGMASASLFDVMGLVPSQGRPFHELEERPDAPPVAILGHDYWQRRFGGEPVLGQMLTVGGNPREIVGVMRAGVHLPDQRIDIWVPPMPALDPAAPAVNWHWVTAVGRLAPGATAADAQAELARLTTRFPELYPSAYDDEFMQRYGFTTYAEPLHATIVGDMSRTLWILLAAVGLVLLIACANVANLYLVRIETRRREVAVRGALGAGRRDLLVHFLGESLIVAAGAAALGVLLAWAGTRVLVALAPENFPRLGDVALTSGAVAFALGIGALTAIVFGLLPMAQRGGGMDTLREGGKGMTASPRRRAARAGLVVAQTALALMLLAAAGLMLQSYRQLRAVDLGIEPANALTFQIALPFSAYPGWEPTFEFHRRLIDRIELVPGVASAGMIDLLPPVASQGCSLLFLEDVPMQPGEEPRCMPLGLASPGAYAALGMRVRGETPTWTEMANQAAGVVVTRAFADRFWPGQDPIGRGVRGNGSEPPYYRVVGVAENVRAHGVDRAPTAAVFFPMMPMEGAPLWSPPYTMSVVVRTTGVPPLALVPQLRAIVAELDRNVPLANIRTMEEVVERSPSMARASFTMLLLLVAGAVALVLSAIGVYAVISYIVAQRTGEIGLRIALGAGTGQVRRLVVRQSLAVVSFGLALGLFGAWSGTRLLESLLFEVSATDPRVLGGAVLALLAVAAAASWLPARRAARVEPMTVLRAE